MILHATNDGRTLLYVEQNHGARLAIFDVTDPAKIKQEAAARLDAPGSFDFVSSLGDRAELIRFRDGQGEAVLDLHKAKLPVIKTVPGLKFQGPTERLGEDGFITVNQASVQSSPNPRDYEVVETGTTYLLAADGLYLIRRPAVEEEYDIHQWQMSHPG
jgi:hypothetical protein